MSQPSNNNVGGPPVPPPAPAAFLTQPEHVPPQLPANTFQSPPTRPSTANIVQDMPATDDSAKRKLFDESKPSYSSEASFQAQEEVQRQDSYEDFWADYEHC